MRDNYNRRKRRRRRRLLQFLSMVIVLSFIVSVVSLILYKVKNTKKEPEYRLYSLSEEASARAYVWLNQIDDMPLDYDDIKAYMGDIDLKVLLTPSDEKGKLSRTLDNGTYDECCNKARYGLTNAYKEVVKYRLLQSGFENEISDEMLDGFMQKAYGMSVAGYLSYCDVKLLPSIDEINAQYCTEISAE